MAAIRDRFNKPAVKSAITIGTIVAVLACAYMVWRSVGTSQASSISRDRAFICSETNKAFEHQIKIGEAVPLLSPYSGKKTGYPAEMCYWTAEGTPKTEPTLVLLNMYQSKNDPTFCPDCKRMVVGLNPAPEPGRKPPITESDYLAKSQNRNSETRQ